MREIDLQVDLKHECSGHMPCSIELYNNLTLKNGNEEIF